MGDTEIRDEKLLWVAVRGVRTASLLYDDEVKGWAGVTTGSGLDF